MNYSEKRSLARFDLPLFSQIITLNGNGDKVYNCVAHDVSAGGAFFLMDKPLPDNTRVSVRMVLPSARRDSVKGKRGLAEISGIVIRTNEQGIAVRFQNHSKLKPYTSPRKKVQPQLRIAPKPYQEETISTAMVAS